MWRDVVGDDVVVVVVVDVVIVAYSRDAHHARMYKFAFVHMHRSCEEERSPYRDHIFLAAMHLSR